MLNTLNSFWNGNGGTWKGYKATTIGATAGIINSVTENSWVFTSLPLAGQTDSNVAEKTFYLLALVLTTAILYGMVGFGVDHLRSNNDAEHRSLLTK